MDLIWEGLRDAVSLLAHNRDDVYEIALRSVYVSGIATLISLVVGVAFGAALAFGVGSLSRSWRAAVSRSCWWLRAKIV